MAQKTYSFTIPAGIGSATDVFHVTGSVFAVLAATAAFAVSFDGESPLGDVERGLKFKRPYDSVKFINQTAAAVTIKVLLGDGDVEDYRPGVRPQIASQGLALWGGTYTGNNFATSQLVETANPDRVDYTIVSPATNVNNAFLISSQAAGKTIDLVYPGQRSTKQYGGAIYLMGGSPGADQIFIFANYY